jgi:intein-encoded DNA endonuclease-like protein
MTPWNLKRPPKEELERLYVKEGLSVSEIAKLYNVSQYAVRRWLKKYSIPTDSKRKPRNWRENISKSVKELWKDPQYRESMLRYRFKKGHIPWNKKNLDVQLIKKLNEMEHEEKEIAELLGVDRHTVRRACKEAGIQLKIYRKKRRIRPNLNPSPSLAYLLGALKGDGNVYSNGVRNIVQLKVKAYSFAYNVYIAMKNIGLRPRLKQSKDKNGKQMWLTYAFSKEFCKWYKTLTYEDLERIAMEYPLDFLRGFYEAEGCRHYNKHGSLRIAIANKNAGLIDICRKILERLGYECSIHERRKQNHYWYELHILGTTEEKKKFLTLLNPCIKGVS